MENMWRNEYLSGIWCGISTHGNYLSVQCFSWVQWLGKVENQITALTSPRASWGQAPSWCAKPCVPCAGGRCEMSLSEGGTDSLEESPLGTDLTVPSPAQDACSKWGAGNWLKPSRFTEMWCTNQWLPLSRGLCRFMIQTYIQRCLSLQNSKQRHTAIDFLSVFFINVSMSLWCIQSLFSHVSM